ncbi:RNase P protein component [Sphingobium cloacae]|uniref:Ribonuclease P protein component n=2 Tax=Sphingobium cloacae TaxID=120107 RepID=A0A1E1F2H7_9SPHN|nr:RNase P protein component [Sphingobium cloacae]
MPGFVLLVRERGDGDPAMRYGITVTKKIGGAVVRNRMKRRFRVLAREMLPLHGVSGADHVLIGRSDGVERDFTALRRELEKALRKIAKAGNPEDGAPRSRQEPGRDGATMRGRGTGRLPARERATP